jgi:16S rRNA (guanine966-N2)-methyltransferase
MRIVGGKFAGRDLTSPNDFRVRPTAERVRVLMLDHLRGDLKDGRMLDLFAGTGALGLEAISRGAKYADFVETRPSSLHALKANIGLLRLAAKTRVFKRDAVQFAEALTQPMYDVAFADPPYNSKMLDRVIASWVTSKFSKVLAVEHALTHIIPYGSYRYVLEDTAFTVYRVE